MRSTYYLVFLGVFENSNGQSVNIAVGEICARAVLLIQSYAEPVSVVPVSVRTVENMHYH